MSGADDLRTAIARAIQDAFAVESGTFEAEAEAVLKLFPNPEYTLAILAAMNYKVRAHDHPSLLITPRHLEETS